MYQTKYSKRPKLVLKLSMFSFYYLKIVINMLEIEKY